jgi:serine/threonine protein kinase
MSKPMDIESTTPEINPTDVELGEMIGEGAFSKVYKGKCRGVEVAIKILKNPASDRKTLSRFQHELTIMSSFFHPNICLFMGACTVSGNFFIVQEYLHKGDVEKMLRNPEVDLSLLIRMKWAKDAALGMNWLHKSNPIFIHRDLKTSNLLIDENDHVKVCDFGLSEVKQQGQMLQDTERAKGTPLWMAPEIMMFQKFNEKVDVYSFGIVLWELLTREIPFKHHSNYEKFKKAVCINSERPVIPDDCENSLKELLKKCFHQNPNLRPSFTDIISSLEEVIIDVTVKDPYGRDFWKQNYLHEEDDIVFERFEKDFFDFLRLPDTDMMNSTQTENYELNRKCLKMLLSNKSNTETDNRRFVKKENFNKFLSFFGPIEDPNGTDWDNTILDSVRLTLKKPWFHGDISTQQSVNILKNCEDETFLIRFSSVEGFFTISQLSQRKVKHQRIKHENGKYIYNEKDVYDSLEDVVRSLGLTKACPGSIYLAQIFDSVDHSYGYVI